MSNPAPSFSLNPALNPRSVALLGASNQPGKMGYRFMENLSRSFPGPIYPINPKEREVMAHAAYPNLRAVPGSVDLAVMVLPPAVIPEGVRDCIACGVKSALIITSGLSGGGPQSGQEERTLLDEARRAGLRLIGPNSFGLANCHLGLNATLQADAPPEPGSIAFLTQSGAFAGAMYLYAIDHQLKFSYIVDNGNSCDVAEHEYLEYFRDDPRTRVVMILLESIRRGRDFVRVAREMTPRKPVVMVKLGRSEGGRRASLSHTASLAGEGSSYEAAFRQAGVVTANTGMEMADIAKGLAWQPLPAGNRVAIISPSGGVGVELTDLCEAAGLRVPMFSPALRAKIAEVIPPIGTASNPIDVTPVWAQFSDIYSRIIELLYTNDEVDMIVPCIVLSSTHMTELLEAVRDTVVRCHREYGRHKPVYILWASLREYLSNRAIFQEAEIPCFEWSSNTAAALAGIVRYASMRQRRG